MRLLVRDDAAQVAASEAFIASGAWVSHLVLAETLWVLYAVYERSAKQIGDAVERLLDHKHLTLQQANVVTAALGQFRRHPSVGFSDCLVFEVARDAGHVPLGTFDKKLARIDGTIRPQVQS